MMYRPLAATAAVALAMALPTHTFAQQGDRDNEQEFRELERTASPDQLLRATLTNVDLNEVPARLALEMWSLQTDVALVINWNALEAEGIDTEAPITLNLRRVPAETALKLILRQMNPQPLGDDKLVVQSTQWYVQVLTRGEALRSSVTKMYFIGDLLMEIPNFEGPEFDLNEALSNTNSGGSNGNSGGGGSGGLFPDDNNQPEEETLSTAERAERIADLIRDTIEPDIWKANGGEYASVRYFRGMLVVSAPEFVHEQIGVPTAAPGTRAATPRAASSSDRQADRSGYDGSSRPARRARRGTGGVAGTNTGVRTVR
jgi:hypothetical protein